MPRVVTSFSELSGLGGRDLGFTEYLQIPQTQIENFVAAIERNVDSTGALSLPHDDGLRTSRVPSFLALSLITPLWSELFDVHDVTAKLNYGLDAVRFITPIRAQARVRLRSVISTVAVEDTYAQVNTFNSMEIEGQHGPAVEATFIARFYR